jgi:hypothetical protein
MIIADLAQFTSAASDAAVATVPTLLAVEPTPQIDTNGVVEFLATKIAPILLAVLGVIFISRAGKGEMSRVLTSSAIAIIGLAFIAGAGLVFFFGKSLVKLVFGQ